MPDTISHIKIDMQIKTQIKKDLPKYVLDAAQTLQAAGHEAYLVGGSVRDILLGKNPKDYDIATNAYPEVVEALFPKSIPTGAKFGTMLVLLPDEAGEMQDIEITTYRSEADYFGGRWPAKVEFTKTIQEDLARRDFTINAIALKLDDAEVTDQDVVDPFGGVKDLQAKLLKAVGDPLERFSEDGLRSLRGCRLAANLGFSFDTATFEAIKDTLHVTKHVSLERVRDEFTKLLLYSAKPSIGIELMRVSGLLELFIPELLECIGVDQPQFHVDDVYTHSLKTVDLAEDSVKLAAMLHDIGKPRTMTQDANGTHFYGHDKVGADMAKEILTRLRFSNAEIAKTTLLIRHHMFYYPTADWRKDSLGKIIAYNEENQIDNITTLTLLRHGQSGLNISGKVNGQVDDPLTVVGREQVTATAEHLAMSKIEVIISSPLSRAQESADIVAAKLNLPVILEPRLAERHFGELQGLSWEEFSLKYPDLASYPGNSAQRQEYLPGGETISAVESRVKVVLFNLLMKHWGKHILLVTHSGIIRVIGRSLGNSAIGVKLTDLANAESLQIDVDHTLLDPNFLTDEQLERVREEHSEASFAGGWKDSAIRRFIRNLGSVEMINELLKLRIADALANPKSAFNPRELQVLSERIAVITAKDMALKITDLDIKGHDLKAELGLQPGKSMGKMLNYLLEKVIDEPLVNEKSQLLELARDYLQSKPDLDELG